MFVFIILSWLFLAALWSPAGKGLTLGSLVCDASLCFVTFPYGVSGQVWYLIQTISAFFTFMESNNVNILSWDASLMFYQNLLN